MDRRGDPAARREALRRAPPGVGRATSEISSGRTGTRRSGLPVASRIAATTAAVETTVGGSPTPLTPYGASGSGILDQHRLDRRHVERGRHEVVGEARVRDPPAARLDLLHHGQAEPLRRPALDLALDRQRVDGAADVLRRADPDDPRQPELDVDLGDDAHRRASRAAHGARSPVIWPVSGSSGRRARMAVDALHVDLARPRALTLLERRAARVADGAGRHPRHARCGRRAGRADGCRRVRHQRDGVGAELGARDLEDDADDALADLGSRAVHVGAAVGVRAARGPRRSRRSPPRSRCS